MKTSESGIEKIEGKRGTVFRVQIRKKGCKHQSRTFTNFKEAKKWKYATFSALATGEITDTAKMRRTTLKHLIERYTENVLDPSSTNYKTRLGQLQWWNQELGHCIATNVSEDVISKALDKLKKTPDRLGKPRKNATVNRYATTLSCLLETACKEWRLIQRNPVRNLKKKSEPKQKKKALTFAECQTLLAVCEDHPSKYALALVALLLCTGFRKGEVLSLKRKHVSLEKELIFLETSKNSDSRVVPLVNPALRHLKNYLLSFDGNENDFIFPGRNKEKPIDFRATWKAILKKADIQDFTTHCTRYTTISLLSELKVPVNIIAQIVGHRTIDVTMHYTVPSLDFIRQELSNLGNEIS